MNKASYNILIIEDNESIRNVLKMTLEIEGFSACEASDGIEALSALKRSPLPNLIFLDLLMPNMNGFEFLESIKKDLTDPVVNIPIIAMSAVANSHRDNLSQTQEVLSKPVDLNKLLELVYRFFGENSAGSGGY
ncbi:MAG: response regulator [Bdellovibrionia bacterium]